MTETTEARVYSDAALKLLDKFITVGKQFTAREGRFFDLLIRALNVGHELFAVPAPDGSMHKSPDFDRLWTGFDVAWSAVAQQNKNVYMSDDKLHIDPEGIEAIENLLLSSSRRNNESYRQIFIRFAQDVLLPTAVQLDRPGAAALSAPVIENRIDFIRFKRKLDQPGPR